MKKFCIALGFFTAAAAPLAAQAQVGASLGIGTLGLGAHATLPLQKNLNARIGVNFLHYSYNDTASNVDYDLKLKLQTLDALLDWYPTESQFRVTGGVSYNGNKIDINAHPSAAATYNFNGVTYTAAQVGSVNGNIDFRNFAPYLGIGWGNALAKDKGWGFAADLGVLFQGKPSATLNATCGPAVTVAQCNALRSDVAAEQASLNNEMEDFKAYPVIRIAATYRF
jgi:hypothetical protein